jgi:hypothetical protein
MGTWDAGSFDNDDAADWANEFTDAPSRVLIEDALKAVTQIGGEYLEAPECSMAIAAAEVVAALHNAPLPQLSGEIRQALGTGKINLDRNLIDLAVKAIERVRSDSELKDLWEEGEPSDWLAAVNDLEDRLRR